MTRKDYVLIAEALRRSRIASSDYDQTVIDHVTSKMIDALSVDNPRFDGERFRAAAGWE